MPKWITLKTWSVIDIPVQSASNSVISYVWSCEVLRAGTLLD